MESTLHSTRLSSQSLRQFLFFAPLPGCSGRRSCPPAGRAKGTWPTSGTILKDGAILVRRALVRNFATGIEIVEDEAVLT